MLEKRKIYLTKKQTADKEICCNIKISRLQDVFCLNLNNSCPSYNNIKNNTTRLYTFVHMMTKQLSPDISKLKIGCHNNIATDYIESYSKKHGGNIDHDGLKRFIEVSCAEDSQERFDATKQNATILCANNQCNNITCGRITNYMIEHHPERFRVYDKITPIPFKVGDILVCYCTIIAEHNQFKQVYEIQHCVVE
jgi:hypothetical protein